MKRSGHVGLVLMGAATFAATFAGGMAYFAWQKPSQAATAQTASGQTCTPRADGTQACEPQRRSFSYYFYPTNWTRGWSWGWGSSYDSSSRTQSAAFTNNSRTGAPPSVAANGTTRGGFGGTASSGSFRVSAGG